MVVKVVTDSAADIPASVVQDLGITVIPLYVRFGTEFYRDGFDLSTEEFYRKLTTDSNLPTTSVPAPAAFIEAYEKLVAETDEIISLHVSSKFSAIYDTALMARDLVPRRCHIEVIDTLSGIMGEGLIAIVAAQAARDGARLDEVVRISRSLIPRMHVLVVFDTLEYLRRGGRIGRAQTFLGNLLKVNSILGIKDGAAYPFARVRTRAKAIRYLQNFVASFSHIAELAVEDATTPDEVDKLVEHLGGLFPKQRIYRSKVNPVVGAHVGPHVIAVALLEGES